MLSYPALFSDINFYLNECHELLREARTMKDNYTYFNLQELVTFYEMTMNAHEQLLCSLPETQEAIFMRRSLYKGLIECYNVLALYICTTEWPRFRCEAIYYEERLKKLNIH